MKIVEVRWEVEGYVCFARLLLPNKAFVNSERYFGLGDCVSLVVKICRSETKRNGVWDARSVPYVRSIERDLFPGLFVVFSLFVVYIIRKTTGVTVASLYPCPSRVSRVSRMSRMCLGTSQGR